MHSKSLLNPLSTHELKLVYNELNVDEHKLQNNVKLLNQWLSYEPHLPDNLDENLLLNFARGCKGTLEKTKLKIEKYLAAKTKLIHMFHREAIVEEHYITYFIHRCMFVFTNYTKGGNRVILFRLPTPDATHFDTINILRYVTLLLDFLLYYDVTAGYEFIYDAENVSGQILSKLNLAAAKHMFELLYNILPIRTRSIFVINPNPVFEIIMRLARSLMPEKLKQRVSNGMVDDLLRCYPTNCIPIEYGGTHRSLDAVCDDYLNLFKNNREWIKSVGNVTLAGPLPEHKKNLYSFEQFNMDGSFRKLNID